MSNSLNDRLKNEYSTQYDLVIDNNIFYPKTQDQPTSVVNEKIATSTTPPSPIDPLRQSLGKIWTYTQQVPATQKEPTFMTQGGINGDPPTEMVSSYLQAGFSWLPAIQYENVSNQWQNIFEKGSYSQSLNLQRKATRVKLFYQSDDLLQNRLGTISVLSNIEIKNSDTPYQVEQQTFQGEDSAFSQFGFSISDSTLAQDGGGGEYGYRKALIADDLPYAYESDSGGASQKLGDIAESMAAIKQQGIDFWENQSLGILNKTIKDARLDSFYDFSTNDYAYDRLYYSDSAFSMPIPMSPRAISLTNTLQKNSAYADIKPVYNYYSDIYENETKKQTFVTSEGQTLPLTERLLPCLYDVPLEKTSEDDPTGTPQGSGENGTENSGSKFKFNKFAYGLSNCEFGAEEVNKSEKSYNTILDQSSKNYVESFEDTKTQFPFFVNFEFNTDSNFEFTTLLSDYGITDTLISSWIGNFFHANTIDQTMAIDPSKDDLITRDATAASPDNNLPGTGYYDPLDLNPSYSELNEEEFQAPICLEEIYKVKSKKDFYSVAPAESSEDAHLIDLLGEGLVKEGDAQNTREYDLNKWLDRYFTDNVFSDSGSSVLSDTKGISYFPYNSQIIKNVSDPDSQQDNTGLIKKIKSLLFMSKYRDLVDQTTRGYDQILAGQLSYSETIFYRIQKVPVDESGNPQTGLVQNFWIKKPSASVEDFSTVMKYADTQVKYEQNYEYTLYAYQVVVGSKYGFQFGHASTALPSATPDKLKQYSEVITNSALSSGFKSLSEAPKNKVYLDKDKSIRNGLFPSANTYSDDMLCIFDVVCEPDVKLVEMPIYKKTVSVSDAPPASPEVDIVPLRGKDNNIKINFLPGTVGQEAVPIIISGEDLYKFHNIRKAQDRDLLKISSTSGMLGMMPKSTLPSFAFVEPRLQFRSDDFVTNYEIYRLETAPKNYTSFANNMLTTLNAREVASLTDDLEQNKKYYYTFRSIDIHGNISNPSAVYQVELVENSGAVYPVITTYDFEKPLDKKKTKSFRRHLKIDAETLQSLPNLELSGLEDAPYALASPNLLLGLKDDALFPRPLEGENTNLTSRKFLFRIKSKHTGKVVDLRVLFKSKKKLPLGEVQQCSGGQQDLAAKIAEVSGD
jgi:hypothetical protein